MKLSGVYKMNWRLIVVHLAAAFFFILAARQLTILSDIGVIESYDKYGSEGWLKGLGKKDYASRLTYFSLWTNSAKSLGLLVAFIVSLVLVIKKKMFWLNALVVLFIGACLSRLGLFDNRVVDVVFFSPANLAAHFGGLPYKFITNGTILLLAGLVIFFGKRTNSFIVNHLTVETND